MSLDSYMQQTTGLVFPEATDRHVRRILGSETDERILDEDIQLSDSDYGGSYVIKGDGTLITPRQLLSIRKQVLERLAAAGLRVGEPMTVPERTKWDRTVGAALAELVSMGPFQTYIGTSDEDAGGNAWTYLSVHVFPEFAGWRFPGRQGAAPEADLLDESEKERVKAVDRVRGGRRNVLFRVWFRSFVLGADHRLPDGADHLSEDELDNIFGRPTISRNHELTRRIVDAIYRNRPNGTRRNFVVRELMKEVRRRYSSVNFAALGEALDEELDRLWEIAEARELAKVKTQKVSPKSNA